MRVPDSPTYEINSRPLSSDSQLRSAVSSSMQKVSNSSNALSPASSWQAPSTSWGSPASLINTKACDLNAEKHLAGAVLNLRSPRARLVHVNKPDDLSVLSRSGAVSKFVFTQDKKLIIGNIDKGAPTKWLSHPAIAEIGGGGGQSGTVVSAGYIKKDFMGQTRLSSTSGHYLPKTSDLRPVQEHLRCMGVNSTKGKCTII